MMVAARGVNLDWVIAQGFFLTAMQMTWHFTCRTFADHCIGSGFIVFFLRLVAYQMAAFSVRWP